MLDEVRIQLTPFGVAQGLLHRLAGLPRGDAPEIRRRDVDLKDLAELHGVVVALGLCERDLVNIVGHSFNHGLVGIHGRVPRIGINLDVDVVVVAVVVLEG